MSWVAAAIGGSAIIGGVVSSRAAGKASDAQTDASNAGVAQQQAQFDAIQKLLQPYVSAGTDALGGQESLIGLNGATSQRKAIDAIANGPEMRALVRQGENGILQNASATGGLRGGNTQGALAEFRPQMLAALIGQQYSRLGGLSSLGQNAAAGVGNAGISTGNQITQLLGQVGSAQAGNALAQGAAINSGISGMAGAFGQYLGGTRAAIPQAPQAGAYGAFDGQFLTGGF
jgi:hypothetical protein